MVSGFPTISTLHRIPVNQQLNLAGQTEKQKNKVGDGFNEFFFKISALHRTPVNQPLNLAGQTEKQNDDFFWNDINEIYLKRVVLNY